MTTIERGTVVEASEVDAITLCDSSEHPNLCPFCGSGSIEIDSVDISDSLQAYTHCKHCDSEWEWNLELTGSITVLVDNFHLQDKGEQQEIRDTV